jgi:hypothetical protein
VRNSQAKILFVPKWAYTYDVLRPIALEMRARGYGVQFLLYEYDGAFIHRVSADGFFVRTLAERGYERRVSQVLRLLRVEELPLRRLIKREVEAVYEAVRPAAVVTVQETRALMRPLIRRANDDGAATVLIQWAFTNPKSDYDAQRADVIRRFGRRKANGGFIFQFRTHADTATPESSMVSRAFARLDRMVSDFASYQPLIRPWRGAYRAMLWPLYRRWNVDYRMQSRSMGGAEARIFTVIGPAFAEQFRREGVDPEKMVVAGLPEHDELYFRTSEDRERDRRTVCARFGFDIERPLAFWAPRASAEDGYDETLVQRQEQAIAEALLARPEGFSVVAKLHPRTDVDRFRSWMKHSPRLAVVLEGDKAELLHACDLFVSTYSTVVLGALALDKPTLTYNLLRIPGGDVYADEVGGVAHARTLEDVPRRLDELLGSENRNVFAAARARARKTHMVFDGQVTPRIADIIERAIAADRASCSHFGTVTGAAHS